MVGFDLDPKNPFRGDIIAASDKTRSLKRSLSSIEELDESMILEELGDDFARMANNPNIPTANLLKKVDSALAIRALNEEGKHIASIGRGGAGIDAVSKNPSPIISRNPSSDNLNIKSMIERSIFYRYRKPLTAGVGGLVGTTITLIGLLIDQIAKGQHLAEMLNLRNLWTKGDIGYCPKPNLTETAVDPIIISKNTSFCFNLFDIYCNGTISIRPHKRSATANLTTTIRTPTTTSSRDGSTDRTPPTTTSSRDGSNDRTTTTPKYIDYEYYDDPDDPSGPRKKRPTNRNRRSVVVAECVEDTSPTVYEILRKLYEIGWNPRFYKNFSIGILYFDCDLAKGKEGLNWNSSDGNELTEFDKYIWHECAIGERKENVEKQLIKVRERKRRWAKEGKKLDEFKYMPNELGNIVLINSAKYANGFIAAEEEHLDTCENMDCIRYGYEHEESMDLLTDEVKAWINSPSAKTNDYLKQINCTANEFLYFCK